MSPLEKIKWLFLVIALFVFSNFTIAQNIDPDDEDSTEITARVARISYIQGDVQIKRLGENDWENASLNVPLVEGDEIATSGNAKVEIQFDSQNFLRLAENSFLKITTLRDEGIAISLNEGTLSLRVFSYEKEKGFFEIDAPQTTISVQNAGLFRIDARNNDQVKITAAENGQVRIYSESSGFLLRSGRSATVFLTDDRLGEWETAVAAQISDEWDSWVAERDNTIAVLLNNSFYDKYYDRDVYGAEDLNNYGSWNNSDDYGWVWRPNQSAISNYNNWSPYRYGHWSWINPYGWTWINDEPWGWATYHHGRWINDNRGWFWTPYSYNQWSNRQANNRPRRSSWRPALVFVFNNGSDICWYPLSHRDRYSNFNRNYQLNNNRQWSQRNIRPDFNRIPQNSIVGVRSNEFGRQRNNVRSISWDRAKQNLEKPSNEQIKLPKRNDRRQDFQQNPIFKRTQVAERMRTGAAVRPVGVELDKRLQNERFRDNRQRNENRQTQTVNSQIPNRVENNDTKRNERNERDNRNPNFERQNQPNRQIIQPTLPKNVGNSEPQPNNSEQNNQSERNRQRNSDDNNQRWRNRENNSVENNRRSREQDRNSDNNNQNNTRRENPSGNRPAYPPRNTNEDKPSTPPVRSEQPQPRPQPQREERREERREQPRVEQPRVEPRREQPRQEQPRQEPRREQPRQEQPRQVQPRPEPRREQPRVEPRREQPRQEQPRREQPREERRYVPPIKSETRKAREPEKIND